MCTLQITCVEDKTFSEEYHDPEKRFIGNALTITLKDGTVMDEVHINYPVGHKRRRAEGTPLLNAKFKTHIQPHFPKAHVDKIIETVEGGDKFRQSSISDFMDMFVVEK